MNLILIHDLVLNINNFSFKIMIIESGDLFGLSYVDIHYCNWTTTRIYSILRL